MQHSDRFASESHSNGRLNGKPKVLDPMIRLPPVTVRRLPIEDPQYLREIREFLRACEAEDTHRRFKEVRAFEAEEARAGEWGALVGFVEYLYDIVTHTRPTRERLQKLLSLIAPHLLLEQRTPELTLVADRLRQGIERFRWRQRGEIYQLFWTHGEEPVSADLGTEIVTQTRHGSVLAIRRDTPELSPHRIGWYDRIPSKGTDAQSMLIYHEQGWEGDRQADVCAHWDREYKWQEGNA